MVALSTSLSSSSSSSSSTSSSSSSSTILSVAAAAAAAAFVSATYLYIQNLKQLKEGDAVDGFPSPPNAHWLFGHLIQMNGGDKGFTRGHSDVYVDHADKRTGRGSFWFFTEPGVSLLQAKDVKLVLQSSSYRKDVSLVAVHTQKFLGPKALVSLMGKEWRLYRSAVHKSFTPAAIRNSQHIIYQVGDLLADTLLKSDAVVGAGAGTDGASATREILPVMKMATIDVFGLAALDVDFKCCENLELSPIANAFDFLTGEYTRRLRTPWDPFSFWYTAPTPANREYQRQQSLIRGFITGQIQKAKDAIAKEEKEASTRSSSSTTTSDVLTNLVKASKAEAAIKGGEVSDEALGDVMMTLLFGGYDTTSITLTYALYLLAKHPEYERICLQEIEAVLGMSTATDDLDVNIGPDQLPFTRAVIMETLRLYPPAPVTSRNVEKDLTLSDPDIVLTKDQLVMLPIWCIQRSELNYPHPTEMLPERWVRQRNNSKKTNGAHSGSTVSKWEERPSDDESSSAVDPGNKDAFCVFSGTGARNCVGKVLAMQESVTLLAMLLRKCKFELIDPDYEVEPFTCAVVQQPKDGLPMKISKR